MAMSIAQVATATNNFVGTDSSTSNSYTIKNIPLIYEYPAQEVKPTKDTNLDWLDRRVNEMRVKL